MTRRAFSLIELLVVIGVIALLSSILLPALRGARETARDTLCLSNLHNLGTAWTVYANDFKDRAMPLAYWSPQDIGTGEEVYWWGSHGTATTPVDHARGFVSPYLDASLGAASVFECPLQPWGSYRAQGLSHEATSTYGYNGYYLSPAKTPGWAATISSRPWRRLGEIPHPSTVFVFADAMLPGSPVRNSALLDPPLLWSGSYWQWNDSPTTSFRHQKRSNLGTTMAVHADSSARPHRADPEWITAPTLAIGSVGTENAPHYVPDAAEWRP